MLIHKTIAIPGQTNLFIMSFTIRINQTESDLAKRLVWYLKSLAQTKEYNFLVIEEEDVILTPEMQQELDFRFEHFLQHHEEYSDWEDVKHKYSAK